MNKFITLLLMLSAAAGLAAQDFTYNGINYTVTNEADKTCVTTTGHNGSLSGHIIIPEKAYYNGEPYSVVGIGETSFLWESSIESVEIQASIDEIGMYAFSNCLNLTKVVMTGSVKSIGFMAFCECPELNSVKLSDSLITIGEVAFGDCSSLISIDIPDSVTTIGNDAFSGCSSLTSIELPNSVTTIGDYAFRNCTALSSITISASVTSIGTNFITGCNKITSINADSENPVYASVEGVLFSKDLATLLAYPIGKEAESYKIPDSVTTIGNYAFSGCSSLTSIDLPDSLTTIGNYAFSGCI